jgi:hypothetical protein
MIPWVDHECRAWGAHKRWLLVGEADGWPEVSVLGRLIKEGPGAGHESFTARVPVKDPPGSYAAINRALRKMADTHVMELPHLVVHYHYLLRGRAKIKAPMLSISIPQYWQQLHAAHAFIVACDVPRESLSRQFCQAVAV